MSFSISSKIIKLLRKDISGGVKMMGRTFMPALCAAIAAIPAMAQPRNEFSLTVADAENANIIVNRSFDGIMLPYNLKGNHLIMPVWLKQDIYSLFGNSEQVLSIPSVALFDSDGKMLQARFPESENAEALIKAIDKALTQTQ